MLPERSILIGKIGGKCQAVINSNETLRIVSNNVCYHDPANGGSMYHGYRIIKEGKKIENLDWQRLTKVEHRKEEGGKKCAFFTRLYDSADCFLQSI